MNEQRVTSGDDTSWAPATGGFLADDAPFGSVLGDPLMGSPLFDVSVLDSTPGTQPEDDVLFQERADLSAEERDQVVRADRIKAGAARRDAAHRQTRAPARTPQPAQQVAVPAALQYGYAPTASPALQQAVWPVAGQYGQPSPAVSRQPSRALAQTGGPQVLTPPTLPQRARPQGSERRRKSGSGSAPLVWLLFLGIILLRACAG